MRHLLRTIALATLLSLGLAGSSQAYDWGLGFGGCGYGVGNIPTPPYFALHPPVYYSDIVARPYGLSPYAYPGWVGAPGAAFVAPVRPLLVANPYMAGAKAVVAAPANEVAPQLVINPHYAPSVAKR